jgi:hypothetical protein
LPETPSVAENNTRLPRAASPVGEDEPAPGAMSSTSLVPPGVPSVAQSSWPAVPSVAEKNIRPPTAVAASGVHPRIPGRMSLTRLVPAAVPSERHSSRPLVPSSAKKSARLPTEVRSWRRGGHCTGAISLTRIGTPPLTSLAQSSAPEAALSARKRTACPTTTNSTGCESGLLEAFWLMSSNSACAQAPMPITSVEERTRARSARGRRFHIEHLLRRANPGGVDPASGAGL